MGAEDKGPHADEHAAWFVDAGETVYALIGSLLTSEEPVNGTHHHVLVGQGLTRPVQDKVVSLFEFFAIPRTESAAADWLDWSAAPSDLLEVFVERGILARVDTASPLSALKSLSGMRFAPEGFPVASDGDKTDAYIGITRTPDGAAENRITPELSQALWTPLGAGEIPETVRLIADRTRQSIDLTARKVLASAAELIEQGLIRLEWVNVSA